MTRRLFFGLSVDPEVGGRILKTVRLALDGSGPIAVYAPDDLHLTLCFLGAVEDSLVPRIRESAREEFRGLSAPELRLGGDAGAFPSREAPRALWADATETPETFGRLAGIRNRAWQVALSHGWRPGQAELTRPFRPHVTVARPREGCSVPTDFWDLGSAREWLPVDVTLFESLSGRGDPARDPGRDAGGAPGSGARYGVLDAWPLAVRPG